MRIKFIISVVVFILIQFGCAAIGDRKPAVDENNPEDFYQKALISANYGLNDEALKYLESALARDPSHFPSLYLLGITQTRKGNLSEARSAFEKCVELEPGNSDIHVRLGSIYQTLELEKEAESEFEKAYQIGQDFISSFNLAQFNLKRDNLEIALNYIQSAIDKNTKSGPAYNIQGVIFNKLKRYPEAISSFLMALKIDSNDYTAGINLGVAYINNKEYDKARELLTRILSLTQDPFLKGKINEYLEAIKNIR